MSPAAIAVAARTEGGRREKPNGEAANVPGTKGNCVRAHPAADLTCRSNTCLGNFSPTPMSDQTPPPLATPTPVPTAPATPGMAVASLVLGIVSVLGGAILLIPTVLAIVFGHISLSRIRKDPKLTGSGIATAGLVLGYVSIVFGIVMAGLLAAMAIPAFQKVRESSMRKVMQNDARQIAAAAQQVMLENGDKPVVFHIDPSTGEVSGPLAVYVKKVAVGTSEVDGTIESSRDTFSLQNPRTNRGKAMVFDASGNLTTN